MTTALMDDPFAQPSASRTTTNPESDNAAYSFDGKPDRWKRYRLPDPETGAPTGYTRSTTFAKAMSDTYSLNVWGNRMVVEGLAKSDDIYAAACALDFEDKDAVNAIAEKAKEFAGAKVGANLGTALHAYSEAVDRGEKINMPPKLRAKIAAWTTLLKRYNMEVVEIERRVLHTRLDGIGVAGTLDRVVRFTKDTVVTMKQGKKEVKHTFKKGDMAILDLKTGKDLSYGWMEIAVQLVVYADANWMFVQPNGPGTEWSYRLMYPEIDKNIALVVHIPAQSDGAHAVLYAVDLKFGREVAELAGLVRAARKRKNVAIALDMVEELAPAGEVIVVPSERAEAGQAALPGAGQALQVRQVTLIEEAMTAMTEEALTNIWFQAMNTRKESAELSNAIVGRRRSLRADSGGN